MSDAMTTTLESIAAEIGRIAGHKWQRPFRTKLCTLRMHLWLHAQEVARLREENKRMREQLDDLVAAEQDEAAAKLRAHAVTCGVVTAELDRIVAAHGVRR